MTLNILIGGPFITSPNKYLYFFFIDLLNMYMIFWKDINPRSHWLAKLTLNLQKLLNVVMQDVPFDELDAQLNDKKHAANGFKKSDDPSKHVSQ